MKMNLLVTLDNNYVPQLKTMLKSFFMSNHAYVDLYVIHSSLTEYSLRSISTVSDRLNVCPIYVEDSYFDGAHFTKRITKETYYRLLLCDYLPESVDRILYLDPDIIVKKPLDKLYTINFGRKCIAGAGHTHSVVKWFNKKRLDMGNNCDYINAGVMMINVDNLRKLMDTKMIFDYVGTMGKRLFQADQDVINALFWKYTIYLPAEIYNLDERTYRHFRLSMDYVEYYTAIIHYDGKNKPWNANYKGVLNVYYDQVTGKNINIVPECEEKILRPFPA